MTVRGREAQMEKGGWKWHCQARDKVWVALDVGERKLRIDHDLTLKGFETHTSYEYDPDRVEYLAVFSLYGSTTRLPLFTHTEPILQFPSEELAAKIALVAG